MTRFSDLPHELVERIVTYLRPANVSLKMEELRHLAGVRLVNKTLAAVLTTACILHSIHLEYTEKSKEAALTAGADRVGRCNKASSIRSLGIHQNFERDYPDDPGQNLSSAYVDSCKSLRTLSLFSYHPLSFRSFSALRRLALNSEYVCTLYGDRDRRTNRPYCLTPHMHIGKISRLETIKFHSYVCNTQHDSLVLGARCDCASMYLRAETLQYAWWLRHVSNQRLNEADNTAHSYNRNTRHLPIVGGVQLRFDCGWTR